jgi:hypothetical protein
MKEIRDLLAQLLLAVQALADKLGDDVQDDAGGKASGGNGSGGGQKAKGGGAGTGGAKGAGAAGKPGAGGAKSEGSGGKPGVKKGKGSGASAGGRQVKAAGGQPAGKQGGGGAREDETGWSRAGKCLRLRDEDWAGALWTMGSFFTALETTAEGGVKGVVVADNREDAEKARSAARGEVDKRGSSGISVILRCETAKEEPWGGVR